MYATDRKVADANVGDLQLQGRLEQGFWDVVTGACVSCEALHGTGGIFLCEALQFGLHEAPASLLRLPVRHCTQTRHCYIHSLIQRK